MTSYLFNVIGGRVPPIFSLSDPLRVEIEEEVGGVEGEEEMGKVWEKNESEEEGEWGEIFRHLLVSDIQFHHFFVFPPPSLPPPLHSTPLPPITM